MSGNLSAAAINKESSHSRQIVRYATGATIIMMIAMIADYNLSYLTPVLALNFLSPGVKPLTFRTSLAFLLTIAGASILSILFTRSFLDYPLVFLPLISMAIFLIYYTARFQKMKVWLIISLLVIPMASLQSPEMGNLIAVNLFINALIAVILVAAVNFLFPFGELEENGAQVQKGPELTDWQNFNAAVIKTLVVVPVLFVFFIFNLAEALLVMVFISILSLNPATANKKAGMAIILANLGGGIAAIIAFNLLTIVPDIFFLGLIALLAGLIFGVRLFDRKPVSPMFGMAYSTFLLILGNVTSFRGEAGEKVWSRIFQLGIVVIYFVVAFALVGRISEKQPKTSTN